MTSNNVRLNGHTWKRFFSASKQFWSSKEVGGKAKWLFALLIFFLFGINGLNVLNSYVGRDFMSAIQDRDYHDFIRMALIYVGVFAASTVVAVIYRFTEERLGLLWRDWGTRRSIMNYGNHRVYYRLKQKGDVDNPDQRISEDIRTYSITTLSFILMFLNGSFTVLAFSGVMWSISPRLFMVSVIYAIVGTYFSYRFGRPLVHLNYDQLDKEANFRSSLTYLRANADSVVLSRREGHLINLNMRNLDDLVANFRRIISVNRNLNFFTTGYNWMIQLIPALVVAPMFISGQVKFGVITQAAMAFTQLLGAFSLIVNQFQSISSYTAVVSRLDSLMEAGSREEAADAERNGFFKDDNAVAYNNLTLHSPHSDRVLIKDLTFQIPYGRRLLVLGSDNTARTGLFFATAGLWDVKEGEIIRPRLDHILFLPESPYLPPGTLRELLMRPWPEEEGIGEASLKTMLVAEERIMEVLRTLDIDGLVGRFNGLDHRQHWENLLTLTEQQLLVIARVLLCEPRFVFMDKPSTTLSPEQVDWILGIFTQHSISYVVFEDAEIPANGENYDAVLELKSNATWSTTPVRDGRIVPEEMEEGAAAAVWQYV